MEEIPSLILLVYYLLLRIEVCVISVFQAVRHSSIQISWLGYKIGLVVTDRYTLGFNTKDHIISIAPIQDICRMLMPVNPPIMVTERHRR